MGSTDTLTLWQRVKAFYLRAQGFSGPAARGWIRQQSRGDSASLEPDSHAKYGLGSASTRSPEKSKDTADRLASERDYWFAQPFNGKYGKWLRDRVSARTIFSPYIEHFEALDFHLLDRDGKVLAIPLSERAKPFQPDLAGLKRFVEQYGPLCLQDCEWGTSIPVELAALNGRIRMGAETLEPSRFDQEIAWLTAQNSLVVGPVLEDGDAARLDIVTVNDRGSDPQIARALLSNRIRSSERSDGSPILVECEIDVESGKYATGFATTPTGVEALTKGDLRSLGMEGSVPHWAPAANLVLRMCRFAPQLRFAQFTLAYTSDEWLIVQANPTPVYHPLFGFDSVSSNFIQARAIEKQANFLDYSATIRTFRRNVRLRIRRTFAGMFYTVGLVPYQSTRWIRDIWRDLLAPTGIPLSKKLWAYWNGFLSYRLPQYGIDRQNRESFISDLEYRWLRHINSKYRYWLEDKISIKYLSSELTGLLPDYYYYVSSSDKGLDVVPMMDLPEGFGASTEEIFRLTNEVGALALKPEDGSHGDGFYRLESVQGTYLLNGQPVTGKEVLEVLRSSNTKYLVTEFITMHEDLARIYPHSVNTLRMIVFKGDGVNPEIGNAYLRIGSSKSGFIDNTAAGGMMADVDLETGRFSNGQILRNGMVEDCAHHPDTGVLIEGQIPGWTEVKDTVLRVATAMPQLEFLGFDVAVTPNGIKFPEINRFPDYPRINKLTPNSVQYLLGKLEQKKRNRGVKDRRSVKPFSLPSRRRSENQSSLS